MWTRYDPHSLVCPQPPQRRFLRLPGLQNDTVEQLLPLFLSLLKDDWPDVRLAIIGKLQAVNQVCHGPCLGECVVSPAFASSTSLYNTQICISRSCVMQVIGIELLAQTLLPAVEDLATDKHWRVRQAIIEHTPMLATQVKCGLQLARDVVPFIQGECMVKHKRKSALSEKISIFLVLARLPLAFAAWSRPLPAEAGQAVHAMASGM